MYLNLLCFETRAVAIVMNLNPQLPLLCIWTRSCHCYVYWTRSCHCYVSKSTQLPLLCTWTRSCHCYAPDPAVAIVMYLNLQLPLLCTWTRSCQYSCHFYVCKPAQLPFLCTWTRSCQCYAPEPAIASVMYLNPQLPVQLPFLCI